MPDQPDVRVITGQALDFRVDMALPKLKAASPEILRGTAVPGQEQRRYGYALAVDGMSQAVKLPGAPHKAMYEHDNAAFGGAAKKQRPVRVGGCRFFLPRIFHAVTPFVTKRFHAMP